MHRVFDDYGYLVPLGKFLVDHDCATQQSGLKQPHYDSNSSLIQDVALFQKRYERFSPEHKRHRRLKEINPDRPKIEENGYLFKQIWLYTQFMSRSKALNER